MKKHRKTFYVQELERQIEQIDCLISNHSAPADVRAWRAQTERVLTDVFGSRSIHVNQYNKIMIEPPVIPIGARQDFLDESFREGFAEARALLNSFLEEISTRSCTELVCPVCFSKDPQFIEFRTVGNVEWQGGVPILRGKKESVRDVAYYKCTKCNRPFYVEVSQAAIQP